MPGRVIDFYRAPPNVPPIVTMTPSAPPSSVEFVDGVCQSIQAALDSLFQHESNLAEGESLSSDRAHDWSATLATLESTIANWQAILDSLGEQVRANQVDLAALDADLNRSLGTFATARKHLQGQSDEANETVKT